MMNTRRSLLTFGALLAAFALLSPGAALAQTVVSEVEVEAAGTTGSIVVSWTLDSGAAEEGEMLEVAYRVVTTAGTAAWMAHGEVARKTMKATIPDLDYSKSYEARVRVIGPDDNPDDWVLSSEATDEDKRMAMPGQPEKPVRVAQPAVTVGDEMLTLEWLEPASELDINLYRVAYTPKGGAKKTKLVLAPATSVTLTSLENDVEYTITVLAESDAGEGLPSRPVKATPKEGAGGTMPTPTPALPLFGAFALGAGVLAAGRARLRRREQRRLAAR